MSVIQPMYFAAGKYSAGTVRKHLSSLFQSASNGTRIEGVIQASDGTHALKVSQSSNLTLSVNTGLCVIADKATQSISTAADIAAQPGVYIAGVDDTPHTLTLASYSALRYDLIYAEVSETSYTITNKALSTNVATLTTGTTAHGFAVGQTVVVSGVDETFDGQHVITAVTTYTFSYAKTASTVSSTAVTPYMQVGATRLTITNKQFTQSTNTAKITTATHSLSGTNQLITVQGLGAPFDGTFHISAIPSTTTIEYKVNRTPAPADVVSTAVSATSSTTAKARVPFAIKAVTGTSSDSPSLPSNTNSIALARVRVSSSTSVTIQDRRVFVPSLGGTYIYSSLSDTSHSVTEPTLPEGSLSYDTYTNTLQYYSSDAAPGSGDTISTLTTSDGSIYGTVSKSDHTHTAPTDYLGISQVSNADTVQSQMFLNGTSSSTILSANKTYIYEGVAYFDDNSSPTYPYAVSFNFNCTQAVSRVDFSFIAWSQTESASIDYSGFYTTTVGNDDFYIQPASFNPAGSTVVEFRGTFVTNSSVNATVQPSISVFGSVTNEAGSYIKFTEVGTNTVTVINGTWF